MEYLILNEESLPFASIEEVNTSFPTFIRIFGAAIQHQFKAIRLSDKLDKGWFEIEVAKGHTLREWLTHQDIESTRKVKSIISKTVTPQIPAEEVLKAERFGLSAFYLFENPAIKTPSLGAAYLLDQLAISLNSAIYWQPKLIKIAHEELTQDAEIEESEAEAKNCCYWRDWEQYLAEFNAERQANLKKGNELWEQREAVFPGLRFVGNTNKQLTKLSLNDTVYNQLYTALKNLNDYCSIQGADYSLKSISEVTRLDISDESDTVKQNPRLRSWREFKIGEERYFFGYHVKNFSGALRLHFKPFPEENLIYIGYFGKHLPTKAK